MGVNPLIAILEFEGHRGTQFLSAERQVYGTPAAPSAGIEVGWTFLFDV